jgi:hypothetical protein
MPSVLTGKTGSYAFWMNISRITDDLLIMANDAYTSRIFIGNNNNMKLETNTNGQEFSFFNGFSTGTWYYVTLTRNDNTVKLYLNGRFVGSMTISGSDHLSVSQVGYKGRSFNGAIDELGIWNRALTDQDVAKLYNNGNGLSYPFSTGISATSKSLAVSEVNAPAEQANPDKSVTLSTDPAADDFFYPNPAGDNLYFGDPSNTGATVSIYDMHGRIVLTRQINTRSIDISSLSKGIYLVKLENNGRSSTHKLMKE